MAGELLGSKLKFFDFGEGGQWGVWPGITPAFNLKLGSISQQTFSTSDFPDEETGTSFAYNGKPGFGGDLEATFNIGKMWGDSAAVRTAELEAKRARRKYDKAVRDARAAELAVKKSEDEIAKLEKELEDLPAKIDKEGEAKKKEALEKRVAELPGTIDELKAKLDQTKAAVQPKFAARDLAEQEADAKLGEVRLQRETAIDQGETAHVNLIIGARYSFDQTHWDLGTKPADTLTGTEVTERRHAASVVIGGQYRAFSIVGGFIFKGVSEFERNATHDQTSGVLVTGAPIPSTQPYPRVLRVDRTFGLGGWDLSFRYFATKINGFLPVEVRLTVGQRVTDPESFVYGEALSAEQKQFREERGVPVPENGGASSADVNPPDDNIVVLGVGFPF